ncbi:MAG: GNAT family N-acetyltransferase [Chloroflexota bacterium]|nr:GNAT family N-acetyltransferase [Chloroflexota bacterium]
MSATDIDRVEVDLCLACERSEQDCRDWRELQVAVYGPSDQRRLGLSARLSWAAIEPDVSWVLQVRVDGRLVSYLWIIERTILIDGAPTRAAGIRGVMTHPDYRRHGFGRIAMQRAAEFTWHAVRPDLALLLSSVMAVPFYQRLGWQTIHGPVLCAQPGGQVSYTEVIPEAPAMVLVPPGGHLPHGVVDLCGLPW